MVNNRKAVRYKKNGHNIFETNKKKAGNFWDSLPVTEIVG